MKSEPLIQTERRMFSFEPVVKDILALFYKRHRCRHDYFRTLLARKVRNISFYTCLYLTMNSFHCFSDTIRKTQIKMKISTEAETSHYS